MNEAFSSQLIVNFIVSFSPQTNITQYTTDRNDSLGIFACFSFIHLQLYDLTENRMNARQFFPSIMPIRWNANMTRTLIILTILCSLHMTLCQSWTPVIVKNVTQLGPQVTPDVTDVSRDGGYSVLINGNILWLYDDTECMDMEGNQLSFISNTAAYSDQPNQNVSTVKDFGVLMTGDDTYGRPQYAILSNTTVGTGGWVPFQQDELDFNEQMKSKERVAICIVPYYKQNPAFKDRN